MRRCGCPTLDPNKNPELWDAYVESVKNAVRSRTNQNEITLAIFASGYLLQDCELLDHLFRDNQLGNWRGLLNLQFIDLNYQINDVQQLKDAVHANPNKEVDWSLMAPAIVVGICGGISTLYAANSKSEKSRNIAIIAGIILIISALILGNAALDNQSGSVSEYKVNDPIMKTIDQFLSEIENQTPFSIHSDFFPNTDVCIGKNRKSDVVIGYDIDNTFAIFENLRGKNLKEDGETIVVTKEERSDKSVVKVMRQASGPQSPYNTKIFR